MFIDDDDDDDCVTPTKPGGFAVSSVPSTKLRVEICETTLFFSIESTIKLFAGNRLIATSKIFDRPPTNAKINAFVRKTILEKRVFLKKIGVDVHKELNNFS